MKRSTFLSAAALIGIVFGLGMLIMPEQAFAMYAITLDGGSRAIAQSLGALVLSVGIMNWIVRNAEDSVALRAVLYGNLAIHALTLVTDILAVTSGAINEQGWISVGLHVVLGGGFGYFAFAKPKMA